MSNKEIPITILMADDDVEDQQLTREALESCHLVNDLFFVDDGEELMDFLNQRGEFSDPKKAPRPGVILLDLNMPRKDGREALEEIKADPKFKDIPIVVLTTSSAEEDVDKCYCKGANSFITKPVTFEGLVDVMNSLGKYWFAIVKLPSKAETKRHAA